MRPVEWEIDERTKVRIASEDGQDVIRIQQGEQDWIEFSAVGASVHSVIKALIEANDAAGWNPVDLVSQGYVADEVG